MKTKILLATLIISALGGFSLTAQEKTVQHGTAQEKTTRNGVTDKGIRTEAEKPSRSNMTVKEWKVDAATNQKVLDHVTIYNEKGKKVEEVEYDGKGQKWRKKYEHGTNGKVAREYVYNQVNKLDNYRTFEFDEFGRKKTEYVYDSKGKLKRYKVYEYIPGESD